LSSSTTRVTTGAEATVTLVVDDDNLDLSADIFNTVGDSYIILAAAALDSGDAVGVRVCIGIAAYSDDVESVAALTGQAKQALQQARRQHERRWNFFGRKFETPALRLVAGDSTEDGDTGPACGA